MRNKMPSRRPKYFPNNWKAYAEMEDEFFLPLSYKDFFNWKVMGWALPSSVACVIREEKNGKVYERIYSQSKSAHKYLESQMNDKRTDTIFTVCDHSAVQVYYPKDRLRNDTSYKHLPQETDPEYWDELTDEEIDELFG